MSWQSFDFGAAGTTIIDGANIYTGTILGTAIKANEITGSHIKAGAITTSHLSFTPVQSNNIVATINASAEGLRIDASKITIDGAVSFGSGYDPTTKATPTDVSTAKSEAISTAASDAASKAATAQATAISTAATDASTKANTAQSNAETNIKSLYGHATNRTLIDGAKIYTGTVLAGAIAAGAITTDKLAVGTVTRQNLITNGHFGSYNTFGDSAQGWTLASGVTTATIFSYTPKTSAGTDGSALNVIKLTKTVSAGVDTVFATQDVTVIPGRTYSVVGLLYVGNSQSSGTAYIRTLTQPGGVRLSSDTSGVSSGEIVPPFYQNATRITSARDSYPVATGWKLLAYRVTIPNGCTQIRIEIGGAFGTSDITNLYPAFIQVYDDDTIEATSSLDMVNQLQNVAFGGDLQGNYLTATVRGLQGRTIAGTTPSHAQVLGWHSTNNQWQSLSISQWLGYTPANKAGEAFTGDVTTTGLLGTSKNLDITSNPTVANTAMAMFGWNRSGGDGEADIIAGGGDGFSTLRVFRRNSDGTTTQHLRVGPDSAFSGKLTATQFNGSGAGLTGTANSLAVNAAAKLVTPRNINGVAFDGTADVTVISAGTGIGVSGSTISIAANYAPNTASNLAPDTDLNTITTPGFYYETTNADATAGSNFPVPLAGALQVYQHAGIAQLYTTYSPTSPEQFFRSLYMGSWSPWRQVIHTGNIATQSVANAVTAGGKAPSNSVAASTLVTRDENSYSYFNYINSNTGNSENPAISQVIVTNGSDHFYRKASLAHLVASMDLSGKTAGNATTFNGNTSNNAMFNLGSVAEASLDTATGNGFYTVNRVGDSSALLCFNAAGSTGPLQMQFDYRGNYKIRNKTDSTTWTAWKSLWHSGNFDPNTKLDTSGGTISGALQVGTEGTRLYLHSSSGVGIYTTPSGGGGWSRGLTFKRYSDGAQLAGWGAMGDYNTVSYLWAGTDYNANWLELTSTYAKVSNSLWLVDASTVLSKGNENSVKITTPYGFMEVGCRNAAYAHFITDRSAFYLNAPTQVNGNLSYYGLNTAMTNVGFQTHSGNGYGYRFWNGGDGYSITMNDYTGAMGAGGYNTGGADYNMSFRMDGDDAHRGGSDHVARGFMFRNGNFNSTHPYAQLAPFGNYTYWGGIFIMRDCGNNNLYGLYFLNGVLYAKQMA